MWAEAHEANERMLISCLQISAHSPHVGRERPGVYVACEPDGKLKCRDKCATITRALLPKQPISSHLTEGASHPEGDRMTVFAALRCCNRHCPFILSAERLIISSAWAGVLPRQSRRMKTRAGSCEGFSTPGVRVGAPARLANAQAC